MGIFGWMRRQSPKRADIEPAYERLAALGFLKYVPPSQHDTVRRQIIASMELGYIEGEWDENCVSSDRRSYAADNEDLAEGQIPECLRLMKDVLQLEEVRFTTVESRRTEALDEVLIDGERFVVIDYATGPRGARDWALATKRLLEIVNELLQRAGSSERLFAINGGNDGRAILLTPQLHESIRTLDFIGKDWMPYPAEEIDLSQYE